MTLARRIRPALTSAMWWVGSRLPHWARRLVCATAPHVIATMPMAALRQWEDNVEGALGRRPSTAERRAMVSSWLRNTMMSLSLAQWSNDDVLNRAIISDEDVAKLRESLAGPGLVLALPHMGSWDFAGAWCTRVGIKVVSVAERLPRGMYERFRDARAGMGMDILPVGQPDLMRSLTTSVTTGKALCLLSDRDLSGRGLEVPWPGTDSLVSVPAGPALVSRLTGCDLRVASTRFHGDRVEILVSDVIPVGTALAMMTAVVSEFAAAVRRHPTSWLMLQPLFREP